MRRGYTREAYIDLVHHIRQIIPNIYLSSDFITGFCGETEEEFQDTLSLIELIKYNKAFLFSYSMREVISILKNSIMLYDILTIESIFINFRKQLRIVVIKMTYHRM